MQDGEALLGGTKDGVLYVILSYFFETCPHFSYPAVSWYCEVPNGTLRAYAFLKTKMYVSSFMITIILTFISSHIDVNPSGTHVLLAHTGGWAELVGIRQSDNKGHVEQVYSSKENEAKIGCSFGATFAKWGQFVLFGSSEGCLLIWDKSKADIAYGLDHGDGAVFFFFVLV